MYPPSEISKDPFDFVTADSQAFLPSQILMWTQIPVRDRPPLFDGAQQFWIRFVFPGFSEYSLIPLSTCYQPPDLFLELFCSFRVSACYPYSDGDLSGSHNGSCALKSPSFWPVFFGNFDAITLYPPRNNGHVRNVPFFSFF